MKTLVTSTLILLVYQAVAQGLYITRAGQISFFSRTPMENIDAVNNEVTSMLNSQNGELAYAVLVKSFHFEKALMEEHFNENYMESSTYPKATFSGIIANKDEIDFTKNGKYAANVNGELTIHGVKRSISTQGFLEISGGNIIAVSSFKIKPADFDIKIPSLVANKIADTIEVTVNCTYQPKQ